MKVSAGAYHKNPAIGKLIATPTVLTMFVIPFAALLSLEDTTIETYVCLAGTSIWEIQNLNISNATAAVLLPVREIKIRRMLEGRCVKIIVAIAPILDTRTEETKPLIPPTILQTASIPPIEEN